MVKLIKTVQRLAKTLALVADEKLTDPEEAPA